MKWEGREQSENVEDQRGMGIKAGAIGGGSIIVVLIAYFLGLDPQKLAQIAPQGGGQQVQQPIDPAEQPLVDFTKTILRDTEIVWGELFRKMGKQYREPTLVLFKGEVRSACGFANAAVGPFYCPGDHKVYIDLAFYQDLQRQLHSPGEFARAYVVAHEVAHHVQNLLGYSGRADEIGRRTTKNEGSVRLELQADYLAGVWAHHAQQKFQFLERGDLESAFNAAQQIGDDKLQRDARGTVRPDTFTHGTSKQRQKWFEHGVRTGNVAEAEQLLVLSYRDL